MPDLRECPVCKTTPIEAENRGDRVNIKCARCGNFGVGGTVAEVLPTLIGRDKRKAALIAHMLSRMQAADIVAHGGGPKG
jgi:hypothetical protein